MQKGPFHKLYLFHKKKKYKKLQIQIETQTHPKTKTNHIANIPDEKFKVDKVLVKSLVNIHEMR